MRIAFIGLGAMGLPMALNLAKVDGLDLVGFDLNPDQLQLLDDHATLAGSVTEAIRGADAVFTVVPADRHVRAVVDEILSAGERVRWFVDFSTISPSTMDAVAADLRRLGTECISVTLTRGTPAARSGDLGLFVGGPEQLPAELVPAFDAMSADVYVVGTLGASKAFKIVNNMLVFTLAALACETIVAAEVAGVTPTAMTDVLLSRGVDSWPLRNLVRKVVVDQNPGTSKFSTLYAMKDLSLSIALGDEKRVPVVMAGAAMAQFRGVAATRYGGLSYMNIVRWLEDGAGYPRPVDVGEPTAPEEALETLLVGARAVQRVMAYEALMLAGSTGLAPDAAARFFAEGSSGNTGFDWWVSEAPGPATAAAVDSLLGDLAPAIRLLEELNVPGALFEAARQRAVSLAQGPASFTPGAA